MLARFEPAQEFKVIFQAKANQLVKNLPRFLVMQPAFDPFVLFDMLGKVRGEAFIEDHLGQR